MRLLLLLTLLFSSNTYSKSLKNDGRNPSSFSGQGEIYYNQCISSLYNHPHFLRASGGVQMSDQLELMGELDKYCVCHAKEDIKQHALLSKHRIGFFFINKQNYLAGLDICLQEKVSKQNRKEFFEIMSTIKLNPIVTHDLIEFLPTAGTKLSSAMRVGPSRQCMKEYFVQACRENSSLYFLFRCLKRKLRDREFFDRSYVTCT